LLSVTKIGSGFGEQTSSSAFVVGPTGVGLGRGGRLFVADTVSNRITSIPGAATRVTTAGTGRVLTSGGALSGPLGMAIAPNGDVLTVNGGNGKIVETSPGGLQVGTRFLDRSGSPPGSGALFGLAVAPGGTGIYFVDDAVNTLRLLH
jgi:sugar lactone lactonase YvrE